MIERRKQSRSDINYPVYFIGSDRDGNITAQDIATGLNVNENGILIESSDYINARFIQIMAQTQHKATIKVKGEIIYSMQSDEGTFRTGVSFEDSTETALLFIDEMIQASSSVNDKSH